MKKIIWRNIIKSIIWRNLIYNIIRCIIAYPLFLIALVISIPFNIVGWILWICTSILAFFHFIFTGDSYPIAYSCIVVLISDFSFEALLIVVFPVTMMIIESINNFNDTLYPIKRSQNEFDRMDMFEKTLEEIKRS